MVGLLLSASCWFNKLAEKEVMAGWILGSDHSRMGNRPGTSEVMQEQKALQLLNTCATQVTQAHCVCHRSR